VTKTVEDRVGIGAPSLSGTNDSHDFGPYSAITSSSSVLCDENTRDHDGVAVETKQQQ
jgi:hypothetical protein